MKTQPDTPDKPGPAAEGNPAAPSQRILVAEDECILRQRNASMLVRAGYAVDVAEDGVAAREALHAHRYDLLITDNNMPRLTGLELLKELRSARMELPVIMATGTPPTQELAKNPWLEPVATLAKPYAADQLLETVKNVLHGVFPEKLPPRVTPNHAGAEACSVERYTPARKREWDNFVNTARNATFLFLRDYMDYHSDRFTDHSLMVFAGGMLVAVLPANLRADGALISHEGLTYGGLAVSRAATLSEVLACFHAILHYLNRRQIGKLLYKRIPALYNTLPDDETAYALFLLGARLYRRDCAAAIPQTDRLPFRRGHRNLIRKATRLGVRILQEESFQPFWERVLAPQLAARYGVKPVHTLEEITRLASRFPEQIRQFSAYCGDEIVAGTTIYETPTVAHAQYGAVTEKGRQTGAQACLFGSLIERYKNKRFFDFGISNEQEGRAVNHGLLNWKEGFGARSYAHDFYEIATGNYTRLEPVLQGRAKTAATPSESDQPARLINFPGPAPSCFTHPKALIDEGATIGRGTRVWAFAHVLSGAVVGEDCNLCDHIFIEGGVRVGHRVTIKCGVYLWDGVVVEDDVFIGPGAVFTNDARPRSRRHLRTYLRTLLKQGCALGASSTTLPGITVGRWAMVGAGSIVTHDVPDYALVVGSPARWRAWVCRCGEKLVPASARQSGGAAGSGRRWGCVCGRWYEQIAENALRESATSDSRPTPPEDRAATNCREPVIEMNGHRAGGVQ